MRQDELQAFMYGDSEIHLDIEGYPDYLQIPVHCDCIEATVSDSHTFSWSLASLTDDRTLRNERVRR